jgi:hypothetical protein
MRGRETAVANNRQFFSQKIIHQAFKIILANDDITCPPGLTCNHCKPEPKLAQNAPFTRRRRRVMVYAGLGAVLIFP